MQCPISKLSTWQVAILRTASEDKRHWFLHLIVKGPGGKVYKLKGLNIHLGQNGVSFGGVEEMTLKPDAIVEPLPATCCFAEPAKSAAA